MITPPSLYCDHCGAALTGQPTDCPICQQQLGTSQPYPHIDPKLAPAAPLPTHIADINSLLLDRYYILDIIGEGGFGKVYQAQDCNQRNKLVAIKQINIAQLTPQEMIEVTDSYNREVSLLTNLLHENLPRIYDHFTDPTHWYLVMDYIDGETLEEYLQKAPTGTLSVQQTIQLGIILCDVLHYLHTRIPPIIFRDVKPANIMRTTNDHLYLIDFGIARRYTPGKTKDTGPLPILPLTPPPANASTRHVSTPQKYARSQITPAKITARRSYSTNSTTNSTRTSTLYGSCQKIPIYKCSLRLSSAHGLFFKALSCMTSLLYLSALSLVA